MDKDQFNFLLSNYTSLTSNESDELVNLVREFPYSQVLHGLSARAAQDVNLYNKESILQCSAIYSSDRSALKSLMTLPRQRRDDFTGNDERTVTKDFMEQEELPLVALPISYNNYDPNSIFYDQIIKDIESMHEAKQAYESTIEELEQNRAIRLTNQKKEEGELEKKNIALKSSDLIEEIKSTKKKIKREEEKQKEQSEIIDEFIKSQPSISRLQSVQEGQEIDLSEHSNQFSESIISETLVKILLTQGKKEKAIDVLKKLIWKFPQKKAYFATQIEDLRK